jgi:hypothetical protein
MVTILNQSSLWMEIHYFLFSRSGFSPALHEQASNQDVRLVEIEQMIQGNTLRKGEDL